MIVLMLKVRRRLRLGLVFPDRFMGTTLEIRRQSTNSFAGISRQEKRNAYGGAIAWSRQRPPIHTARQILGHQKVTATSEAESPNCLKHFPELSTKKSLQNLAFLKLLDVFDQISQRSLSLPVDGS